MNKVLIPIFRPDKPETVCVEIPDSDANLFTRIIRDPTNPNRPMRERRCAEMLCALLLNCESLRNNLFIEWSCLCGWTSPPPITKLEYDIATEQSISGKRDDLRIVGFSNEDDGNKKIVVWTVEIKVKAGLHDSSQVTFDETEGDSDEEFLEVADSESDVADIESEVEDVSQLENYDRWLEQQVAEYRAGIVISPSSLTDKVNKLNLKHDRWRCIRWADLGECVQQALKSEELPVSEQMLARHFVGFVLKHLGDNEDMASNTLGIDDLALIRAFAVEGSNCVTRIDRLVGSLLTVFEDSGIQYGAGPTYSAKNFFSKAGNLSCLIKTFLLPKKAGRLRLFAGVEKDKAKVFIASSRKWGHKSQVRNICQQNKHALESLDSAWTVFDIDHNSDRDVQLQKSLAWLLSEEDQEAAFKSFFDTALNDMKSTGLIAALQAVTTKN